jgi:hypothetical protein
MLGASDDRHRGRLVVHGVGSSRSGVMRRTTPWCTVRRMSRLRSWIAPSLSLVLAASGCSKPAEGDAPPAAPPAAGDAAKKPAGGDAKADVVAKDTPKDAVKEEGAPPVDSALAATVAAMIEAETSYPAALDPLLDLVPAGSPVLVVVRDVDDLLAVADGVS